MLEPDGDPQPEQSVPDPAELSDFAAEAASFQKKSKAKARAKPKHNVMLWVIAAVLLAGFLIAACEAMQQV